LEQSRSPPARKQSGPPKGSILFDAKRYRYYTSQTVIRQAGTGPVITRFPAQELERFVKSQIHLLLQAPEKCTVGMKNSPSKDTAAERAQELARKWPKLEISKQHEFTRNILKRVVLGQTTVRIEIERTKLLQTLLAEDSEALTSLRTHNPDILKLTSDFQVLRRGSELRLITVQNGTGCEGAPVLPLAKAIARARNWHQRIVAGEVNTIGQLAQESGLTRRYVRRILQCAILSPQITEALLTGKHRPNLTLKEILYNVPLNWREQEQRLLRPL
jgi:site-specific DNA recombinase